MRKVLAYFCSMLLCLNVMFIESRALYAFKLTGEDVKYFQIVLDAVDEAVANDGETGNRMLGDISANRSYVTDETQLEKQLFSILDTGEYIFNIYVYEGLSKKDKKETMKVFVNSVQAQNFSVDAKQKISYALREIDDGYVQGVVDDIVAGTKADVVSAMSWLVDAIPYIRIALGVLVILGVFGLVFMLVIDLFYINAPFLQRMFPPEKEDGFKPITRTARMVVIEYTQTTSSGKSMNVTLAYLKRQLLFFVIYIVVLAMLATGSFSEVIANIIRKF